MRVNSYPSVHSDPIPPQPIHCLRNGYSGGGEKPAGSQLSKGVIWSQAHKLAPDGYRALASCLRAPSADLSAKPVEANSLAVLQIELVRGARAHG